MAVYVEYPLEDGTLLVKVPENDGIEGIEGLFECSLTDNDTVIIKAGKRFSEAFHNITRSVSEIKKELQSAQADEVEVKFGLVTTGKLGNFAVGEVGVEANYEVTLKWKKPNTSNKVRVKKGSINT